MLGRRRRKENKKRVAWDAAAALLEVPAAALAPVAPPAPEPAPEPLAPPPAPAAAPAPAPPAAPPPVPTAALAAELTTPVVEPAPEPPEPPPLRYFADDGAAGASSDSPTPVLRFKAVDPEAPEVEAETRQGAAEEEPAGPLAVRLGGSRLVARPGASRAFAERMRSSQHAMAQLSMHMDAWMDQAVELRTQLIAEWDADELRPSYTDFVVRAVARSLTRHPQLNSVVREEEIELLPDVDIGITTPLDAAFSVLVIAGADQHSLKEIAAESRSLAAEHGDSSSVTGPEPTFIVASLGAYGVDAFTPIVLAPNVATLGIGRVRDETRWEGDRPVRSSIMTLTLAWDHRALGGAVAAEFLAEVREMLEQPYRLLVD